MSISDVEKLFIEEALSERLLTDDEKANLEDWLFENITSPQWVIRAQAEKEHLAETNAIRQQEGLTEIERMHVSWGPSAKNMSKDQLKTHLNEIETWIKNHEALPIEEKMRQEIKNVHFDLKYAMEMSSYDRLAEYMERPKPSYEELTERLRAVHSTLEFAILHLGNWTERSVNKDEILEKARINKTEHLLRR